MTSPGASRDFFVPPTQNFLRREILNATKLKLKKKDTMKKLLQCTQSDLTTSRWAFADDSRQHIPRSLERESQSTDAGATICAHTEGSSNKLGRSMYLTDRTEGEYFPGSIADGIQRRGDKRLSETSCFPYEGQCRRLLQTRQRRGRTDMCKCLRSQKHVAKGNFYFCFLLEFLSCQQDKCTVSHEEHT